MYRLIVRWYVERFNTLEKISIFVLQQYLFIWYHIRCEYKSYNVYSLCQNLERFTSSQVILGVIKLGVQKVNNCKDAFC